MTLLFTEEPSWEGAAEAMQKKGRKYAKLAVEYADLRLLSAEDLDDNDMVLTASLVGAPNAENQFMTPADLVKTIVLLQRNCDFLLPGSLPMNRAEKQR